MPRWLHIVIQVLSTAAGAYISYKTGSPLPSVISTGVSGLTGVVQQAYNTDGTPQAAPFPPPAVPVSQLAAAATSQQEQDAWQKIRQAGAGK